MRMRHADFPAPGDTSVNADSGQRTVEREWRRGPDGVMTLTGISPFRQALDRSVTGSTKRVADWFQRHWLALVTSALALLLAGAVVTPLFYAFGWPQVGAALFAAYHLICAQVPSHSYFLLGYQLALCARNLAIYGSMFAGSLLFRWTRAWLPALDWRLWLVTMLPMALDGGTQLFGWHESNWELRTLTGVIFGLGVCWFILPRIQVAEPVSVGTRLLTSVAPA